MGRHAKSAVTPSWRMLVELALDQGGFFSLDQALELGFSRPRLQHHVSTGKLERPLRGVYRLVEHPRSAQDEYISHWLWTRREGVLSHESALSLHGLSDALPRRIHLTVPEAWTRRRLKPPPLLVLHCADLSSVDREWMGAVPVTTVPRTLADCEAEGVSPELLVQARAQARSLGLLPAATRGQRG